MEYLKVENLFKSYRGNGELIPVLQGISLFLEEGEFVSILGPSGCGKSTLLNVLMGILPYDEGAIFFKGKKVKNLIGKAAYLIQRDLLLPWRKVYRNVTLFPEIQGKPLEEEVKKAKKLLNELGLKGFEDYYPAQLSGGMRQRVALARTLMSELDLFILDEPFGALDAITRSQMQMLLLNIWKKYRKTILLVTHDVEEALILSDRIYIFTQRPARIKELIFVDIPRPREVTSKEFVELKAKILELLKTDSKK